MADMKVKFLEGGKILTDVGEVARRVREEYAKEQKVLFMVYKGESLSESEPHALLLFGKGMSYERAHEFLNAHRKDFLDFRGGGLLGKYEGGGAWVAFTSAECKKIFGFSTPICKGIKDLLQQEISLAVEQLFNKPSSKGDSE